MQHGIQVCERACTHAFFFRVVVQWMHATFFSHVLSVADMCTIMPVNTSCTLACLYNFRTQLVTFVRGFASYSKPICELHVKHALELRRIEACCKRADVSAFNMCIQDHSMFIFDTVNMLFFQNQLRHKNTCSPHHILRHVENYGTLAVSKKRRRVKGGDAQELQYRPPASTMPVINRDTKGQTLDAGAEMDAEFDNLWHMLDEPTEVAQDGDALPPLFDVDIECLWR